MNDNSKFVLSEFPYSEKVYSYFIIRNFLENALLITDYKTPEEFKDIIILNSEGKQALKYIKITFPNANTLDIELSLFMYSPKFIDLKKIDFEKFMSLLENEIISKRIRYPWPFDNILYNKYFDRFPPNKLVLSNEDTNFLLDNTSQGVYQIDNVIVGPLGIFYSADKRFFNPQKSIPLWHCGNPVCKNEHFVKLNDSESIIREIRKHMKDNTDLYGKLPKYPKKEQFGEPTWFDFMHFGDLPTFLGQVFSETEIRHILEYLLNNFSKVIRGLLPNNERIRKIFSAQPKDIVNKLDKPECLQTILLAENHLIIKAIEMLIEKQTITIPHTELREMRHSYRTKGAPRVKIQCSKFGIRIVNRDGVQENSYNILRNLIIDIYDIENDSRRLHWKLRNLDKDDIYEKLDLYLSTENPKDVIKNLILDDAPYIEKTVKFLKFGNDDFPNFEEEELFIKKVLWKLGFNINSYPSHEKDFWEKHNKFSNVVKRIEKIGKEERELVREVGVNYFVLLEKILNNSLSFITWALFSDHIKNTNLKINLNFTETKIFMAKKFNKEQEGINEPLIFDLKGNNTLFPLIKGFDLLANICDSYLEKPRDEFKRPLSEMPSYQSKSKLLRFPFIHQILLFDVREEDLRKMIKAFRDIYKILDSANVCNVRNRIKHDRPVEEFPQKQEFLETLDAIQNAIYKIESYGIAPTVFMYSSSQSDQFGHATSDYTDYTGNKISLSEHTPYSYSLKGMLKRREPQIIIKTLHINKSIEKIRFSVGEESEYTNLWKGYPKKKLKEDKPEDNINI